MDPSYPSILEPYRSHVLLKSETWLIYYLPDFTSYLHMQSRSEGEPAPGNLSTMGYQYV
jgi:hypothetical protein